MKAKLTIKPGCEAGSLYCEGCDFQTTSFCRVYDETLNQTEWESNLRCQPCLDAEQKEEK